MSDGAEATGAQQVTRLTLLESQTRHFDVADWCQNFVKFEPSDAKTSGKYEGFSTAKAGSVGQLITENFDDVTEEISELEVLSLAAQERRIVQNDNTAVLSDVSECTADNTFDNFTKTSQTQEFCVSTDSTDSAAVAAVCAGSLSAFVTGRDAADLDLDTNRDASNIGYPGGDRTRKPQQPVTCRGIQLGAGIRDSDNGICLETERFILDTGQIAETRFRESILAWVSETQSISKDGGQSWQ